MSYGGGIIQQLYDSCGPEGSGPYALCGFIFGAGAELPSDNSLRPQVTLCSFGEVVAAALVRSMPKSWHDDDYTAVVGTTRNKASHHMLSGSWHSVPPTRPLPLLADYGRFSGKRRCGVAAHANCGSRQNWGFVTFSCRLRGSRTHPARAKYIPTYPRLCFH